MRYCSVLFITALTAYVCECVFVRVCVCVSVEREGGRKAGMCGCGCLSVWVGVSRALFLATLPRLICPSAKPDSVCFQRSSCCSIHLHWQHSGNLESMGECWGLRLGSIWISVRVGKKLNAKENVRRRIPVHELSVCKGSRCEAGDNNN